MNPLAVEIPLTTTPDGMQSWTVIAACLTPSSPA
jgi:hypothetical protein